MAKGDRWSDDPDVKVREMRNAETVLGVIRERKFKAETTGELLEIERLTSSLEGGRWKSAIGNSLAAYPTSSPVRRGADGKGRSRLPVTADADGLTNPGIRRNLASRLPYEDSRKLETFQMEPCG